MYLNKGGITLDSIDYKILEELQKNARISMKKLGNIIGLTAPAVSERIKKMEKDRVIEGYSTLINPAKLGKKIKVLINVSMPVENREEFFKLIEESPNVINCHHVTGSYCMVIKALFVEMKELEELIYKIQKYGDTNTLIILSTPLKKKVIL